jgi:hypothetical protein
VEKVNNGGIPIILVRKRTIIGVLQTFLRKNLDIWVSRPYLCSAKARFACGLALRD